MQRLGRLIAVALALALAGALADPVARRHNRRVVEKSKSLLYFFFVYSHQYDCKVVGRTALPFALHRSTSRVVPGHQCDCVVVA